MQFNEVDGRLLLRRDAEEKQPLLSRLSRIEGQVRGLRQMVESDRHCGEVLQQTAAITSALREVTLLCIEDNIEAGIHNAVQVRRNGADARSEEAGAAEMVRLLRAALKQ